MDERKDHDQFTVTLNRMARRVLPETFNVWFA